MKICDKCEQPIRKRIVGKKPGGENVWRWCRANDQGSPAGGLHAPIDCPRGGYHKPLTEGMS